MPAGLVRLSGGVGARDALHATGAAVAGKAADIEAEGLHREFFLG